MEMVALYQLRQLPGRGTTGTTGVAQLAQLERGPAEKSAKLSNGSP